MHLKSFQTVLNKNCKIVYFDYDNFVVLYCQFVNGVKSMTKKTAVINDLSGFGKCSLTAAIAILSVMGIQPCPLPTAILTNQTGYKNHYCYDYSKHMHFYTEMWLKNNAHFDGIYSGYIAGESQADFIKKFIEVFRKSDTKVIVDPVMGDNGKLYSAYNKNTCDKMKELAKTADIITPNLTELCILAGEDFNSVMKKSDSDFFFEYIEEVAMKAIFHNNMKIAVTGIKKDGFIYNGVFEKASSDFFKSREYGSSFSGTGDIFSSIICGSVLNNIDLSKAVKNATKFIEDVIKETIKEPYEKNHGIDFEKYLYKLALNME